MPDASPRRGRLWVDGGFLARVRGPGPEPGRVVRVREPFALIGRLPGSAIRIDDPAVDDRHALLLLDRRGIFGVDLLSRTGTRFAGQPVASGWFGAGDTLEIAGRRLDLLRLQIDGQAIDPPLSTDDPLADADGPDLARLTLEPLDDRGSPWTIGSALAVVGSAEGLAIRIEGASATHAALLRTTEAAYLIDLLGGRTRINDRPVVGGSALVDGDVTTIGPARFTARIGPTAPRSAGPSAIARLADGPGSEVEVLQILQRFQADASVIFRAQSDRIDALNREIAALRDQIGPSRGPLDLPQAHPRLLPPDRTIADSVRSATWMIDRLHHLGPTSPPGWREILRRITALVGPDRPDPSEPALPKIAQDRS